MSLALSLRVISFASLYPLSRANGLATCTSHDGVDAALEEEAAMAQVTLLAVSSQMFRFHIDADKEATVVLNSAATSDAIKDALEQEFLSADNHESGVELMANVQADEDRQEAVAKAVLHDAAESGIASVAGTAKLSDAEQVRAMEEEVKKVAAEEERYKHEVEGETDSFFPDIAKALRNEPADSSLTAASLDVVVSEAIETEFKTLEYYGSHQEFLDYVQTAEGVDEQEDVAKIALKELTGLRMGPDQGVDMELLRALEAEVVKVAVEEETFELNVEGLTEVVAEDLGSAQPVDASHPETASLKDLGSAQPVDASDAVREAEAAKVKDLESAQPVDASDAVHEAEAAKLKDLGSAQPVDASDVVHEAEAGPMVSSGFSLAKEASSGVAGAEGDFGAPFVSPF